jgi:hypothetical protein
MVNFRVILVLWVFSTIKSCKVSVFLVLRELTAVALVLSLVLIVLLQKRSFCLAEVLAINADLADTKMSWERSRANFVRLAVMGMI